MNVKATLSPDDLARACADAMLKQDDASSGLGMTIVDIGPGRATLSMTVQPHMVNGHPVTDTYVFVLADHLPLFAPLRQIAGILQLTPLTEPVLGGIEPLVRLLVDMGYTDRQNLNPEKPVQFSLITPPAKVVEAVAGVPGAIGQGVTNAVTGVESIPSSIPSPFTATNSPSITAKSPLSTSPTRTSLR